MVEGLTLVELERKDECCGFGGTFSIKEPDISVKMGKDRIRDHVSKDAEIITSGDMSCLMHLEGIITRNKIPVKVRHLAEILNAEES
jgi:L-lactate dehydrogenase complex protein LldE